MTDRTPFEPARWFTFAADSLTDDDPDAPMRSWPMGVVEYSTEATADLWQVETRRTCVARWLRRWVCRAIGHDFSRGHRYVEHPSGNENPWCSRCRSFIKGDA